MENGDKLSESDACTVCPEGKYSGSGASICALCPSGRYIEDEGTDETLHAQADACVDCPFGELSDAARKKCSSCKAGQYTYNDELCVRCPLGTYAPVALKDGCFNCTAGSYASNITGGVISATRCSSCDAGTYDEARPPAGACGVKRGAPAAPKKGRSIMSPGLPKPPQT